jgi:CRISPR-associated protein Cmr2
MYYGITIGPIIETLSKGKKTVEIWAASYMFSNMMKKTAYRLKEKNVKFIVPFVEGEYEEKDDGIGMFHDRLIFESDMPIDEIENIIKKVKKEMAEDIAETINEDKEKVNSYFQKYVKTYIAAKKECENPILEIYSVLDNLEYNEEIYEYEDYIDKFLVRENVLKLSLIHI